MGPGPGAGRGGGARGRRRGVVPGGGRRRAHPQGCAGLHRARRDGPAARRRGGRQRATPRAAGGAVCRCRDPASRPTSRPLHRQRCHGRGPGLAAGGQGARALTPDDPGGQLAAGRADPGPRTGRVVSPFRGAGLPSAAPRFLPRRGLTGLGPRRAAPRRLLIGATAAALLLAGCSGGGQLAEPTVGTTEVSSTSAGTRTGDQDGTMTSAPVPTSSPSAGGGAPRSPLAPSLDAGSGPPSAQELDRARRDVSDLTDRQLVGQLVVAAYSGTDAQTGAALVRDHHLGGLITLGGNVPESVDAR